MKNMFKMTVVGLLVLAPAAYGMDFFGRAWEKTKAGVQWTFDHQDEIADSVKSGLSYAREKVHDATEWVESHPKEIVAGVGAAVALYKAPAVVKLAWKNKGKLIGGVAAAVAINHALKETAAEEAATDDEGIDPTMLEGIMRAGGAMVGQSSDVAVGSEPANEDLLAQEAALLAVPLSETVGSRADAVDPVLVGKDQAPVPAMAGMAAAEAARVVSPELSALISALEQDIEANRFVSNSGTPLAFADALMRLRATKKYSVELATLNKARGKDNGLQVFTEQLAALRMRSA